MLPSFVLHRYLSRLRGHDTQYKGFSKSKTNPKLYQSKPSLSREPAVNDVQCKVTKILSFYKECLAYAVFADEMHKIKINSFGRPFFASCKSGCIFNNKNSRTLQGLFFKNPLEVEKFFHLSR